MRIVFAGSPALSVPVLKYLVDHPQLSIVGVLTKPPARAGRGRKEQPSAIDIFATEYDLPVQRPDTLKDHGIKQTLKDWDADLGVVVAYGKIIPKDVLEIPRYGWINIHFSALPRWRGAAPVQRAIEAGDDHLAATIFQLETGLDTGPIYWQKTWPMPGSPNAQEALNYLTQKSLPGLEQSIELIKSGIPAKKQSETGVSYAPQISVSHCEIPWEKEAEVVERHVRAFTPNPGAWTWWRDARCKIGPLSIEKIPEDLRPDQANYLTTIGGRLSPGQILATKKAVWVGTGTEPVRLGMIAPAGKKHLEAADWARGANLTKDSYFGRHSDV